jgi:transcriptional regulator with XRE-family HTH domain
VELGQRVRQLRVQRALTQAELAAASGVGRATVNRVEAGTVTPQLRTLRSLAGALHAQTPTLTRGLEQLWVNPQGEARSSTPVHALGARRSIRDR